MRVVFLSLVVLLTLTCVSAAAKPTAVPTSVFSQADATRVQKYLTSLQQKDGTFGDAIATSYATSTFALLSTSVPHSKEICSHTLTALNGAKDIATVTPLITTLVSSSCDFHLPSTTKTLLQQGLQSKSLSTLYITTHAIISLVKAKRTSVGDYDLSTVSKTVIDLLEDDGTYRISSDADADATAYHAGMALHILGDVFASTPEMEETSRTAIRLATKKISDLIKLGGDHLDYTLGTDVSQIEAASVVIRGVITFANAISEAVEVTDNQINRFANLFLTNQYTHNTAELHATLSALYAIAGNNIYVPIVLTVVESTPSSIRVRVTNVVDSFATKLGVQLSSITSADGTVIASNIVLTSKSEDSVEYTLPSTPAWNKAEPGFYTLKFTLEAKSGFSGGERYKLNGVYTRTTKVVTDVTGGEFSASVSESAKGLETDQVARASHPSSLKSKLSVDTSKYLHLKIQIIAKIQPNQVFIQLIKSGKSAIFVAKYSNNGNYALKLNFGSSEVTEALYGSGDYEVYVLVGDSLLAHGLRWRVATVAATIPDATSHDDDTVFQPKPEIKHIFRQPDPRPSRFVAFIFSALVLVPLAGFIVSLVRFGVRLSLPTNPSELLSAVIFQGSIGAILVLYILYWLHLNIFQALAGGAVLGVIAIFSGNSALRALHARTADGKHKAE